MKIKSGDIKRRGLASLMLVLFLSLWSISNLFYHTHVVDSEIITHSHPYTGASHSHSGSEYQTISLLSLGLVSLSFMALYLLEPCRICRTLSICKEEIKIFSPEDSSLLRAPPAVC